MEPAELFVTRLKCCSDIFVSANDGLAFCCLTALKQYKQHPLSIPLTVDGERCRNKKQQHKPLRQLMHISCTFLNIPHLNGNHIENLSLCAKTCLFQRRSGLLIHSFPIYNHRLPISIFSHHQKHISNSTHFCLHLIYNHVVIWAAQPHPGQQEYNGNIM